MADQKVSGSIFHKFTSWLLANPDASEIENYSSDEATLRQQVEEAKECWLTARAYFDNLSEPDLIDYAIYTLEAAERRYMYLLKQLKAVGNEYEIE